MKTRLNVLLAIVGIATVLLAGCVSSKKYKASQAALQEMRNDSGRLAQQVDSLNGTIRNMEQKNTSLQRSLDSSTSNYATQQKSLDYYQEYFNKQQGTLSQVSEELKGALTQAGLANADVQQMNDAIYVNLDENSVFKKNSTTVTTSGKQALSSLAQVIKNRSDVVNVTVSDSDSSGSQSTAMTGETPSNNANATVDNMAANPAPRRHRTHQGMAHKRSTASKAAVADSSTKVAVTHKRPKKKYASSEGAMTFSSNPSMMSKNRSWMLKQRRVNSVANGLLQNGVPKVNLLMQQPISNGGAQSSNIKVIITPTMNDFNPQKNSSAKGN